MLYYMGSWNIELRFEKYLFYQLAERCTGACPWRRWSRARGCACWGGRARLHLILPWTRWLLLGHFTSSYSWKKFLWQSALQKVPRQCNLYTLILVFDQIVPADEQAQTQWTVWQLHRWAFYAFHQWGMFSLTSVILPDTFEELCSHWNIWNLWPECSYQGKVHFMCKW